MTHYVNPTNEKPGRFYGQYLLGDTMELTDGSIWEYHPEVGWFPTRIGTVTSTTNPLTGGVAFSAPITTQLICTAAPVALTGTLTVTILRTVPIPDGLMGPNSILRIRPIFTFTNGANNKTMTMNIGPSYPATQFYNKVRTTSAGENPLIELQNRGVLTSQLQRYSAANVYGIGATAVPTVESLNFGTSGMNLYVTGTLANIADTITLESLHVEIVNPRL